MRATILSVASLLLSFSILCLGHGLHNTLLGLRASLESFPDWVLGIMMSGYFLGFILGTILCARLIPIIGQIRTFAAFASVASVVSLFHSFFVNEWTWTFLRVIYGVCVAGLYMVIESWLNALATRKNRGQLLAIYMTLSFLSLSLGQLFVFIAEPSEYVLFAVVSILISISLVPLTISKAQQPAEIHTEHFSFRRLFFISPLATIGCFSTGLTLGAFWGLSAVYYSQIGLPTKEVGLILGITFIGGLMFQWPLGYLSDAFDRRKTIASALLVSVIVCTIFVVFVGREESGISPALVVLALFYGGFSYTLYSLFLALANDFLEPKFAVKASAGLLIYHAIGAIFGPTLAALAMQGIGSSGLFAFIGVVNVSVLGLAARQIYFGKEIPEATSESFVSFPETTMAGLELDPRAET